MEELCGIKDRKIGGGRVDLPTIIKMLDVIDEAKYTRDGVRLAYEKHLGDQSKVSQEEWTKWYYDTATTEGRVSSRTLSSTDVAGKGNETTDSKTLAGHLNFKGYTKTKGKSNKLYSYTIQRKLKSLNVEIIEHGPLTPGRIAKELIIIEAAIDKDSAITRLKKEQVRTVKNIERTFANDLEKAKILIQAIGLNIDLVAENNQIAAYDELQQRLKSKNIDFTEFDELYAKAFAILKAMDGIEVDKVEVANKIITDDRANTTEKLIAKVLRALTAGDLGENVQEYFQSRFTSIAKNLKDKHLSGLTRNQLATILNGIEALENGFVPSNFYKVLSILKHEIEGSILNDGYQSSKGAIGSIGRHVSNAYDGLNNIFGGTDKARNVKNAVARRLESNAKYRADELLNISGTPIQDIILNPLSSSNQGLQDYRREWSERGVELTAKHKKAFKLNRNERTKHHSLISLYLYEREYQTNQGKSGLLSADKAIQKIIDNHDLTDDYGPEAIKMLEGIRDKYTKGGWNLENLWKDLGKEGQEIINFNDQAAKDALAKIAILAVRRGELPPLYKNYVSHSLIDTETGGDVVEEGLRNSILSNDSPQSGLFIARTNAGNNMPRLFDPVGNIVRAQASIGLEYFMGQAIQDAKKTMKVAYEKAKAEGNAEAMEVALGVQQSIVGTIFREIVTATTTPSSLERGFKKILKNTYLAQLASVPRMASEATSNLAFALLYKPLEYTQGLQDDIIWANDRGLEVMRALKSTSLTKIYGQGSSPHIETSFWTPQRHTKLRYLTPSGAKVASTVDFIQHSWVVGYSHQAAVSIGEFMLSAPDRMITKPLFFGVLQAEFKNITGSPMNYDLVSSDTDAGRKYRTDNADALARARQKADLVVIQAGATNDAYLGIGNMQYDPEAAGITNALKATRFYMLRFSLFEFSSAQTAIKAMQGKSQLTEQEGGQLMAAITARMMIYAPIYAALSKMMLNMFGLDEEDDDLGFADDLKFSFIGSLLQLSLMRNMGLFGREGAAFLIESFNEEYLEGLRNGEQYDPWKHALVFRLYSADDFDGKKGLWGPALEATGPLRPILADLDRLIKYGTPEDLMLFYLTYSARLPVPKDVNRIFKAYQWENLQKEKAAKKPKKTNKKSGKSAKIVY